MSTTKYLFSGFGGQGILFAGKFIAYKGLIEEKGRMDLPGRPLIYGTTAHFLRTFCVSDLSELPPLPEKSEEQLQKALTEPKEAPDKKNPPDALVNLTINTCIRVSDAGFSSLLSVSSDFWFLSTFRLL